MEKYKINLTKNQYYQIKDFYRESLLEQCGIMYASLNGNNIEINEIDFFSNDMLEDSTEKSVTISEECFYNIVLYTLGNNYNTLIFIHTHPDNGIAYLSEADKHALKSETTVFKNSDINVLAVECVVGNKGLNFFIWDDELNDAIRLDCYVDGIIEKDAEKKGLLQRFFDSLNEGYYKMLRCNLKK